MSEPPLIRLRGVSRGYREADESHPVLSGIDLEVRRGECLALLGRSGSGKSTLLNLLGGIDRLDAGEIWIAGERIDRLPEPRRTLFRRRHIGIIYQFFNLIHTLRVAENVRLPLELNGVPEPQIAPRVAHLLGQVGLAERSRSFPDQLSGGEQQRVAIARALAHQPLLLLADEPTGNLDGETGREVLDLLTGISRGERQTLVLVTHSLQVARRADRVVTLEGGSLVQGATEVAW
jgi:putative ABC transport system ATP-binding protein